jgi:1-deoxy-D-xylulose-5-phosphate reductoisomerase
MAKCISILGSTGSIGTQALQVVSVLGIKVIALTANKNIDLVEKQAREFNPKLVSVTNEQDAMELARKLSDTDTEVVWGIDGLVKAATMKEADTVLTAVVGISGLIPTLSAIKAGKNIALANKETLVTAGSLVMREAMINEVSIIPVDSEHSAIFQALQGNNIKDVERLIITTSGGPFRGMSKDQLSKVTLDDALRHPNWNMGKKITIDSATLMNKGLEVIEAKYIFDMQVDKIDVVVHHQSIIHSMVEYIDGSIIAQMGVPSMLIPIQYALTFPERKKNSFTRLDFTKTGTLNFEQPNLDSFPCLRLAFDALAAGGNATVVLNAANELAVELFLQSKISFIDIPILIENSLKNYNHIINPNIDDIIDTDRICREFFKCNF